MAGRRAVVLFDIDLTLVRIPVDREGIAAALDEATGRGGLLEGFDYRGRSDRWLIAEVAARHGLGRAGDRRRVSRPGRLRLAARVASRP